MPTGGRFFPFTLTTACHVTRANLKFAYFLAIVVLAFTTFLSVTAASEIPHVRLPRHGSRKDMAFCAIDRRSLVFFCTPWSHPERTYGIWCGAESRRGRRTG
jgi:hypothetical protein